MKNASSGETPEQRIERENKERQKQANANFEASQTAMLTAANRVLEDDAADASMKDRLRRMFSKENTDERYAQMLAAFSSIDDKISTFNESAIGKALHLIPAFHVAMGLYQAIKTDYDLTMKWLEEKGWSKPGDNLRKWISHLPSYEKEPDKFIEAAETSIKKAEKSLAHGNEWLQHQDSVRAHKPGVQVAPAAAVDSVTATPTKSN